MKIQFTIYSDMGYRPMSTIVDVPDIRELEKPDRLKYWKKRALTRITAQRYKNGWDLLAHGYTNLKWRIYDETERKEYERKKAIAKLQAMINKKICAD